MGGGGNKGENEEGNGLGWGVGDAVYLQGGVQLGEVEVGGKGVVLLSTPSIHLTMSYMATPGLEDFVLLRGEGRGGFLC